MQNLGGQTKSIMVFSEVAYCSKTSLTAGVASSHSKGRQGLARESGTTEAVRFCEQSESAVFDWR